MDWVQWCTRCFEREALARGVGVTVEWQPWGAWYLVRHERWSVATKQKTSVQLTVSEEALRGARVGIDIYSHVVGQLVGIAEGPPLPPGRYEKVLLRRD